MFVYSVCDLGYYIAITTGRYSKLVSMLQAS